MSADLATDDYGMPTVVTRQWVVEHSEPDELGAVPIPSDRSRGLETHMIYRVKCTCESLEPDCPCSEDEAAEWEIDSYEG